MGAEGIAQEDLGSRFFEPSKLAGLEKLRFSTVRSVEGLYSGRHITKRKGGSGEFVDYREYTPGDDLRRVDWKAMGRMDRAYLKMYQSETDLSCTMLVDASGSMYLGAKSYRDAQGSKLEWVQYFSTALAHLVLLGRDAVGFKSACAIKNTYLPPSTATLHRSLLLKEIELLKASGTTNFERSLEELFLQVKRRGVLILLSDFLLESFDDVLANLRKFRARGWEVIAMHIVHPYEEFLPEGNAFRFIGLESEGFLNCQIQEVRKEYETKFANHLAATRAGLLGVGCDYHFVSTSESYLDVLQTFLVSRRS